jgi:hypothetical protein
MNIYRYKVLIPFTILDKLFLKDDEFFISQYDVKFNKNQVLFTIDRDKIGSNSSDTFWNIKNTLSGIFYVIQFYRDQ